AGRHRLILPAQADGRTASCGPAVVVGGAMCPLAEPSAVALWRGPALWAWGRGSVPGGDEDLAQDPRGLGQRLPVRLGALFETVAEPGVATLAASEDHLLSGLGEGDLHLAAIPGMGGAGDEPLLLEPAQGPRHD